MATKRQANEDLSLLFKRDWVPPTMVYDGSKEKAVKKEFRNKLCDACFHYKPLEPYSPQSNAAKMNIRELKRRSYRKMIKKAITKETLGSLPGT